MIKNIVKTLLIVASLLILVVFYLSIFGIKTAKFNNQIKYKISKINKGVELDLKKIKMTLSPLDLMVNIKTLNTTIIFNNRKIELESLKAKYLYWNCLKINFY